MQVGHMQETTKVQLGERDFAIDATRGIAIVAVVLFHVTRGFESAGWLSSSYALSFADSFAYSFHVPTFLLISGYLAFPKAGDIRFQLQRQVWLYHAYLLWSLVSWVLVATMNSAVNNPVSLHDLLLMPVVPIQHFWFLLSLMLGIAMLFLLRTAWALLAGILVALAVTPLLAGLPAPLGGMNSLCMVLIGGLIRVSGMTPKASLPAAILCIAVMVGTLWLRMTPSGPTDLFPAARLLMALLGCYAAYSFASAAGNGRAGAILAYFGQHTMVIFLLHVIAGSGLRVILSRMVPGLDASIGILLVLIASFALPLIFEWMVARVGAEGLLGLKPLFFNKRAASPTAIDPAPASS